jgi:hypothetical protein
MFYFPPLPFLLCLSVMGVIGIAGMLAVGFMSYKITSGGDIRLGATRRDLIRAEKK